MKRIIIWVVLLLIVYTIICLLLYVKQEKFIFHPKKVSSNYIYQFNRNFEEKIFVTKDSINLNSVFFAADSSKGLIFFLHGSGGNVERYRQSIPHYAQLDYDILFLDYRGYGKSDGTLNSEDQFFEDVETVYSELRSIYNEGNVVIIGFSIGTVPAAMLASRNNPKLLVLEAPHYSYLEKAKKKIPILPISLIMKYKFETYRFVEQTKSPIIIFHGEKDEVNDYKNSLKLKQHLKSNDRVIILKNESHRDFAENKEYLEALKEILK